MLKINGAIYQVPAAGVTIANTTMAANTFYYIYAWMNGGTMTLSYATTTHVTSSAASNVGVEIMNGAETHTLVGMVRTNASSQFQDTLTFRGVRSWFNDDGIAAFVSSSTPIGSITSASGTPEIDSAAVIVIAGWLNELFSVVINCQNLNTGASAINNIYATLNSSVIVTGSQGVSSNGGVLTSIHFCSVATATGGFTFDGYQRFAIAVAVANAGTATFAQKGIMVSTVRR